VYCIGRFVFQGLVWPLVVADVDGLLDDRRRFALVAQAVDQLQ
jgi:hypothetical protein